MGFKEDADFARFVSMGAYGTASVGRVLRDVHDHDVVELERYSMCNKVWQTKVKRLRLPDLVCLRCGKRVEARAKSKLGIIISHSEREGRQWNAGGLRHEDLFAFVRADLSRSVPRISAPVFFTRGALEAVRSVARVSDPKAASEGSEVTISWPSWVPDRDGIVEGVDSEERIVCRWDDGKQSRYWQWRRWGTKGYLYAGTGTRIVAGETMVAGAVAPEAAVDCVGDVWGLEEALISDDQAERYAAVKAAGIRARRDLGERLSEIASKDGDWRMRLEASAALARMEPGRWTRRVVSAAAESESPDEARMEAVFVLGEINDDEAAEALFSVAEDRGNPVELRAAAAWGLGRGARARPDLVMRLTGSEERLVGLHAIVALVAVPDDLVGTLIQTIRSGDDRAAAAAAQVLSRHNKVAALALAAAEGGRVRQWALSALGDLDPAEVREAFGGVLDAETEGALGPMWVRQNDWLRHDEGREGLEALDVQTVRFDPVTLEG